MAPTTWNCGSRTALAFSPNYCDYPNAQCNNPQYNQQQYVSAYQQAIQAFESKGYNGFTEMLEARRPQDRGNRAFGFAHTEEDRAVHKHIFFDL